MALKISALVSLVRVQTSRVHADVQKVGVELKHTLTSGGSPVTIPARSRVNAALPAKKPSPIRTELWKPSHACTSPSSRWKRSLLGKFALGATLGGTTVTVVRSLHTGTITAMPLKVNLESADGDWKKTKEFLLSLSVEDRRHYYRTSGSVQLKDIPVWTPTTGLCEHARYQRNEKLDCKISLYSGDITKLEVDAIVNAAIDNDGNIIMHCDNMASYPLHTISASISPCIEGLSHGTVWRSIISEFAYREG